MILVSSCLAGLEVRYNGTHCLDKTIRQLVEENQAISVCPELLGGFLTPREPAEIVGGNGADVLDGRAKVVEKSGRDVTEQYIKGAYATLRKAQEVDATLVILKEFSPSCGSSMIYNGEFIDKKIVGNGVTTALLKRNGIQVVSEERLTDFLDGNFK
ncbi:DUF523 domain-containing protein [Paenibacillus marinisediminis]